MNSKPKIGLALGSGSARGLAHIGVLKALEELKIEIDIIAGTSAGALVGGLYSCGFSPTNLQYIANNIDRKTWLDITLPTKGVIKGDKIQELVKGISLNKNIEDLDKKLAIVATDLRRGSSHVFKEGPIHEAIRASISIPGIFEPIILNDMVLVDGAITDRVPVSIVKEMGADVIIGVDVGFGKYFSRRTLTFFEVIIRSIETMSNRLTETDLVLANVLIEPSLSDIVAYNFERVDECVEIGYESTMLKKDLILSEINK